MGGFAVIPTRKAWIKGYQLADIGDILVVTSPRGRTEHRFGPDDVIELDLADDDDLSVEVSPEWVAP